MRDEYSRRRSANPSYSLRAFSRSIAVPAGRMSEIFSGKRRLTRELGEKIAMRLFDTPADVNTFVALIEKLNAEQLKASNSRQQKKKRPTSKSGAVYTQLDVDAFHLIADWQYYAILSLMRTSDFQADPAWVSARLGITTVEVQGALERLERLGMIEKKGKKIQRTKGPITTTFDVPSQALRQSHKQNITQALEALDNVSVELRDITSITMPLNPECLPEVKALIKDFRRNLSKIAEEGNCSEVYNLNVQLFPVTKVRGGYRR